MINRVPNKREQITKQIIDLKTYHEQNPTNYNIKRVLNDFKKRGFNLNTETSSSAKVQSGSNQIGGNTLRVITIGMVTFGFSNVFNLNFNESNTPNGLINTLLLKETVISTRNRNIAPDIEIKVSDIDIKVSDIDIQSKFIKCNNSSSISIDVKEISVSLNKAFLDRHKNAGTSAGGGNKEYINLQSGGKRLIRHGPKGGRYYMKGGNKHYLR